MLPVSSAGLSALVSRLTGTEIAYDQMFMAISGLGVLAAVAAVWNREIIKTLAALGGMVYDIAANLLILILNKNVRYRRIICTAYRKIAVMLLISVIPSALIGGLFGSYARTLFGNLLICSVGMLLTAMLLMVASFAEKHSRGPKRAGYLSSVITGAFYGFSVFPGVSRIGTAMAGGVINEFTARFTAAYAFLLYFFTGVFSAVAGIASAAGTPGTAGPWEYIIGTAVSAVSGYYVLRLLKKKLKASMCLKFAVIGAVCGIILLIVYFASR